MCSPVHGRLHGHGESAGGRAGRLVRLVDRRGGGQRAVTCAKGKHVGGSANKSEGGILG